MADNIDGESLENSANVQSENNCGEIIPANDTEANYPNQESSSFAEATEDKKENMEVHHHPDLHHKRKSFREYFLEFLMIFLAVTLGFFAEQFREDISRSHHEKDFMKSMLEDLNADSANLQTASLFGRNIADGLDSLSSTLYESVTKMNEPELYRLAGSYLRIVGVTFSDQTSSQLRTGGMSYIKNRKVANAIAAYWSGIKNVEGPQENYRNRLIAAGDISYTIFNGKYASDVRIDSLTHLTHVKIDSTAKLMTYDATVLVGFANRIRTMHHMLTNFYLVNLKSQYNSCIALSSLIKREYNFE